MLERPSIRLCILLLVGATAWSQERTNTDWPNYGNDTGGTRYSPLALIDRTNVTKLKQAWVYHTGALEPESKLNRKAAFETTPIVVEGIMYLSTPFDQVIALNPENGEEIWKYDPQVDRTKNYSEVTSRGVATWIDTKASPSILKGGCLRRVYIATIDARLIAISGSDGSPCRDFGVDGIVDLTKGIQLKDAGQYQVTSPPVVINDLVVVGSSIGDNRRFDSELGTVRAFNARSGKLEWSWDPIPPEKGTGAANAWSAMSVDVGRNLLFVPTGSASPDFYGARRLGNDANANSVVALDAPSGTIVWKFQVVHHDLWDYDVAAQPSLITVRYNGQDVPAVAVNTKMGNLFVLDRVTGKPIYDVAERTVPKTDVPGEQSAPTQPFPSNPPLAPQSLRSHDAWGITPEEKAACKERLDNLRTEGIFTPPSTTGSVIFPGNVGGVNWGGAAFDPKHRLLVVATNRLATMVRLIPREKFERERQEDPAGANPNRLGAEFGTQGGTAYGMYREMLVSPKGLPCNAPPWGALTAVDLDTGKKKWEVPLGKVKLPDGTEIPGDLNLGGPMVTAGGLVFIAAARSDRVLRAFDVETGKLLWEGDLPASAQATPMSYRLKGKQYVVIAAGGHGKLGSMQGDAVVAFALP
jgi:quinoprotein glucose dehydrogenase